MPPTKRMGPAYYAYVLDPINPLMPNQYYGAWLSTHGSPHGRYKQSLSSPSHLLVVHEYVNSNPISYSEGFQQGIPTLQPGKQYILALNHLKVNKYGPAETFVDFTDAAPNDGLPGRFQIGTWPANSFQQQNIMQFWASTSGWKTEVACFTPTQAWSHIWLYAKKDSARYNGGTQLDDIELIENFNFGKGDTTICDTTATVPLSTKCDSFLNLTATYVWRNLSTNAIVGNTRTVMVSPNVTTEYEVTRNFAGLSCPGKDTVTVTIDSLTLPLDLGPDTAICAPQLIALDAGHWGPQYGYRWYRNGQQEPDTLQSYLVLKSGTYMVELISPGGCIIRDTIEVTIHPEVSIYPDTFSICHPDTFVTFDAGDGYLSYMWDGDPSQISRYFTTNMVGTHFVTVTDTNGCTGTDTALLELITFSFSLGPDTVICEGSCVNLSAPYDTGHTYLWNGGNTQFDTLACDSGVYWVTLTDSLGCTYTDTLEIFVHKKPNITLSDKGPYCWHDTDILFIDSLYNGRYFGSTFLIGQYYVIGQDGAPPGIDSVALLYPSSKYILGDTSKCYFTDSFAVHVVAPPTPQIDTLGPYCFGDWGDTLTATPEPGIFRDSLGNALTFFSPDSFGAGTHRISYEHTDSNGCTGYDTIEILVKPPLLVKIVGDTNLACIPVSGMALRAQVSGYPLDTFYYNWSTGDTTASTTANNGGYYWVQVFDKDSICGGIDTIYITQNLCCEMEPREPFFGVDTGNIDTIYVDSTFGIVNIVDDTFAFERVISVEPGGHLSIETSRLIMLNCSKIVVKRGGLLTVDDSHLGGCGWHGIEVWGHWDACSDEFGPGEQGRAILTNSKITDADIGVFSGKRSGTDYNPEFIGGVIESDGCHYKHNYVDIFFTPWAVGAICQCADPNGRLWQSKIENNVFDTLAEDYYCEPFVDSVLSRIDRFLQLPYGNPPFSHLCSPSIWLPSNIQLTSRCHIVDLGPYVEYDIYRAPLLQCVDGCLRKGWEDGDPLFNNAHPGNITKNNSYYPLNGCHNAIPHSEFK
ncbi:MAG: hypothetical protein KDC92_05250 [Bacteroidetes bacterium]|nr:hypothetical protein [Bacteroidota bacterium]